MYATKNQRVALIIIDMQQGMATEKAGERNNPQTEANIQRLLATWRQSQQPVVHVRHLSRSPESPFWPGQSGVLFQPAFEPLATEHIVDKKRARCVHSLWVRALVTRPQRPSAGRRRRQYQ